MLVRYFILIFLLLVPCCLLQAEDELWLQWRGADRANHSPSHGLLQSWVKQKPALLWQTEGLGSGYSSLSIAGDQIFTTGDFAEGQAVVALNAADGTLLWKTPITQGDPVHGYAGARSTPTFDEDRLFVVASDGQIVCLNAKTGAIEWNKSFEKEWDGRMMSGWGFSESPLVDGDLVICTPGGPEATVVALNKLTGEEVWRCQVPEFDEGKNEDGRKLKQGAAYSSIVISQAAGVKQYIQLLGQGIVGIRAADGTFLWGSAAAANNVANISTPIVSDDLVFYSTANGGGAELLKIVKKDDKCVAERVYYLNPRVLENQHGGMVLVDGHVYCGHKRNSGFPMCIELASGKVKWGGKIRGEGDGSAAVTYADGNLIFRYQDGLVVLIKATPDAYEVRGTFSPVFQSGNSWAHPVVVDKKLYLREQDKLMCYDLDAGQ